MVSLFLEPHFPLKRSSFFFPSPSEPRVLTEFISVIKPLYDKFPCDQISTFKWALLLQAQPFPQHRVDWFRNSCIYWGWHSNVHKLWMILLEFYVKWFCQMFQASGARSVAPCQSSCLENTRPWVPVSAMHPHYYHHPAFQTSFLEIFLPSVTSTSCQLEFCPWSPTMTKYGVPWQSQAELVLQRSSLIILNFPLIRKSLSLWFN